MHRDHKVLSRGKDEVRAEIGACADQMPAHLSNIWRVLTPTPITLPMKELIIKSLCFYQEHEQQLTECSADDAQLGTSL